MSKRYVIQVNLSTGENAHWQTVQHPAGGDWMTRSRSTAIADAAKLVQSGETRELRIAVSKPVYEVTPDVDFEQILAAKAELNAFANKSIIVLDEDEDDDEDEDEDVDDDAGFELVNESNEPDGNAHNNN